MLAKMWKKILLAICIIACLFNLTAKLVNRHSLESNLKSADDGSTVLDAIKTETEEENIIIDNTETKNSKKRENTIKQNSKNTTVVEKEETETSIESENEEPEENQSENKQTYKYTDFVVTF